MICKIKCFKILRGFSRNRRNLNPNWTGQPDDWVYPAVGTSDGLLILEELPTSRKTSNGRQGFLIGAPSNGDRRMNDPINSRLELFPVTTTCKAKNGHEYLTIGGLMLVPPGR